MRSCLLKLMQVTRGNQSTLNAKKKKPLINQGFLAFDECGRWDLNPHKRNAYKILSLARLPVPTLPRIHYVIFTFLSGKVTAEDGT